jgi:hypothetical protein
LLNAGPDTNILNEYMNWELYEVWAVNDDGSEDLIETTKSLKEARKIATVNLSEDCMECVIYQENEAGDLIEIEIIK